MYHMSSPLVVSVAQRLLSIIESIAQPVSSIESIARPSVHSFIPAISIAPLQVLYTTQRRSRLQHGYCIGVSRRSAQATAGKGLAQGHYVTAKAGVEPTTLRLKVVDSTKAPSRPTRRHITSWDQER